jgi:hypothetical protein
MKRQLNKERQAAITYNVCISDTMNIQLIDKQNNNYRLLIDGFKCLFIPMELFTKGLFPVKKCLNNNSLGWYVNRKFVSYKQIKKSITAPSPTPPPQ